MSKVIGIDLGTTNSLVAYMDGREPRVIEDPKEGKLVPSVISFGEHGKVSVGVSAKNQKVTNASRTVYSVKRFMGKGIEDLKADLAFLPFKLSIDSQDQVLRIKVHDKNYTPPELSAIILKELKGRAEDFFGEEIRKVVITVPAYFNDSQRQATKDAGKIAGLEVLRIVNEPTAASLAYGLDKRKQGIVAVYDLGGGTFDISLLKLHDGIFEVLATNGDTHLGGDDMDNVLTKLLLDEIKSQYPDTDIEDDKELIQQVKVASEEAKIKLSSAVETTLAIRLNGEDKMYERRLSQSELQDVIRDLIERTVPPCKQAMRDAALTSSDIGEVVLVGGSTRIPLVKQVVQEIFEKEPHSDLNPDEVVAMGAAVQADILAGGIQDLLLLDVTPLSLGIETMGGVMSKLIHRNSTIPTSAKEVFTTFVDGQTSVDIHVLQGERELVVDNRSLARFQLKEIEPMPAGLPRVEVTFLIDANGILNVTANDLRSGKEQSLEVKPSYGLTDGEVERMVRESIEFAKSDFDQRLLIEARQEAETVIRAAEKSLEEGKDLVSSEEMDRIKQSLAAVRQAVAGSDHNLIRDKLEEFNQVSTHLAELLMDSALKVALKNKAVSEVS